MAENQVTVEMLLAKIGQMSVQIDLLNSAIEQLKNENEGLKKAALEEASKEK